MTDKLNLQSLNIPEEKREELLRIFPEVRTEGGQIDFDRLRLALGDMVDTGKERYGLNWPGKAACFKAIQTPSMGTLLPAPGESVNFDTTENLIIEGDNLEVLKLLQKSYIGKVKMIYIDPPYNTGNDFIYPDNYSESLQTYLEYTGQTGEEGKRFSSNTDTDGRFHSKWLNMMYPRLYLARDLLRDDGFIVTSIDDNELYNLRVLMNEAFGEENFVAVLVYDRNRKNDAKLFSVGHEYMVVYGKNKNHLSDINLRLRASKEGLDEVRSEFDRLRIVHSEKWDEVEAGIREFYSHIGKDDPRFPLTRFKKVDEKGPYRIDGNPSWPGGGGPRYEVLHPKTGLPCKVPSSGWRWPTYERMKEEIDKGYIVFGPDETTIPSVRMNLFENTDQVMTSVIFSYAQKATQNLENIFQTKNVFDNPKNHIDLAKLVAYLSVSGDIILDFFAGSGTTAHAVLDLNKQDGGNRKFILVQLPEPTDRTDYPTIADITKERVRRVIKKLNDEDGNEKHQDRGFRVFKLAESNFTPWDGSIDQSPEALSRQMEMHIEHVRQGRSDEDILYEILLKSGFPLSISVQTLQVDGKTVYSIQDGLMLVCLDRNLTMPLVQAIVDRLPERVVFLDEGFAGNDALKVNAKEACKLKNIVFKVV